MEILKELTSMVKKAKSIKCKRHEFTLIMDNDVVVHSVIELNEYLKPEIVVEVNGELFHREIIDDKNRGAALNLFELMFRRRWELKKADRVDASGLWESIK